MALCLIDAQSGWSGFVRSFFVSCFIGAARGGGGHLKTTASGPHTPADAIKWASIAMNPSLKRKKKIGPLDEPPWHMAFDAAAVGSACEAFERAGDPGRVRSARSGAG